MIHNIGFSQKMEFKPAPSSDHKPQCLAQKFLPEGMDLINNGATALVSLTHRIKPYNALDSMKRYQLHQQQVMMGKCSIPIGTAYLFRGRFNFVCDVSHCENNVTTFVIIIYDILCINIPLP